MPSAAIVPQWLSAGRLAESVPIGEDREDLLYVSAELIHFAGHRARSFAAARGPIDARRRPAPTATATACPTPGRLPSASIRSRRRRPTARPTIPTATASATRDEFLAGTHPRGLFARRLAEGAANALLLVAARARQPETDRRARARVGAARRRHRAAPAADRRRRALAPHAGRRGPRRRGRTSSASRSTSDVAIGADRVMTWNGVGSHAEVADRRAPAGSGTSPRAPPADRSTSSTCCRTRAAGPPRSPCASCGRRPSRRSTAPTIVPPRSRYTIWVERHRRRSPATDVSAVDHVDRGHRRRARDVPRRRRPRRSPPATPRRRSSRRRSSWFLAEGATGASSTSTSSSPTRRRRRR